MISSDMSILITCGTTPTKYIHGRKKDHKNSQTQTSSVQVVVYKPTAHDSGTYLDEFKFCMRLLLMETYLYILELAHIPLPGLHRKAEHSAG